MRKLLLLLLLAVAGCFRVVDLDTPPPDAGFWGDAGFDADASPGDASGLPDAGL